MRNLIASAFALAHVAAQLERREKEVRNEVGLEPTRLRTLGLGILALALLVTVIVVARRRRVRMPPASFASLAGMAARVTAMPLLLYLRQRYKRSYAVQLQCYAPCCDLALLFASSVIPLVLTLAPTKRNTPKHRPPPPPPPLFGVSVAVARGAGLDVNVAVAPGAGLGVNVAVARGAGLDVNVAVAPGAGLDVNVAVGKGTGLVIGLSERGDVPTLRFAFAWACAVRMTPRSSAKNNTVQLISAAVGQK